MDEMPEPRLDTKIVGKGRDLVLINALLSDRTAYEPLADRISGERRLIMVNLPGFGASPATAASLDDHADAVAGLFDELALPAGTDILANGLGSFVASKLAIRHGQKFGRMVLVGSGIAFPEVGRATFRALADKVEAEGMGAVAGAATKRMFPDAFIAASPAVVAERERAFKAIDPTVFAASCRLLAALDLGPDLAKIRNPTLVIIGLEDGATPPAIGRELAARLPDGRAIEMAGVGHCPHIQVPDAFVAAIAPFLGLKVAA
jgi:pimeloyl-ACP methyl ester carboxylesterase